MALVLAIYPGRLQQGQPLGSVSILKHVYVAFLSVCWRNWLSRGRGVPEPAEANADGLDLGLDDVYIHTYTVRQSGTT